MAVRTTSALVQGVLMDDFGTRRDGSTPDLTPYILSASLIVDRVVVCGARKVTAGTLATNITDDGTTGCEAEVLERWLAGHCYVQSDQTLASKGVSGSSRSHHGQTGMRLENSKYGQMALLLDPTGCLENMNSVPRARAGFTWLGKPPSEQIAYSDRD